MSCSQSIALSSLSALSACFLFHRPIMERLSYKFSQHLNSYLQKNNPNRIIIIRHGESTGNIDMRIYKTTPDNKVPLTNKGKEESIKAGQKLKRLIKSESVCFYVSPYVRAIQTYEGILKSFTSNKTSFVIDPRLREQEFGNYFIEDRDTLIKRLRVGKFYYRFNEGENGSDCYDRLTMFKEKLFKDCSEHTKRNRIENIIIVSHGLTMRLFLMNFFNMSIDQFHNMPLPANCAYYLIEKNSRGQYELKNRLKYHQNKV